MRRASRRAHHILYKTTCLITGRFYIGIHSTDDLEDGYLGSGRRIHNSIRKHGRENHVREILESFDSRQKLCEREAEIVNSKMLADVNCMNLMEGGSACPKFIGKDTRERMSLAKLGKKQHKAWRDARAAAMKGHVVTEETKEKLRRIALEQWSRRYNGDDTAIGKKEKVTCPSETS